jgi:hypothetical protein
MLMRRPEGIKEKKKTEVRENPTCTVYSLLKYYNLPKFPLERIYRIYN